jgi:hypothetical protein
MSVDHHPPSLRPSGPPRLLRLAVAASLFPLLAGCAGAVADVHLPAKAQGARTVAHAASGPVTASEQVVAAYTDFTLAMAAAFASHSPARVGELLRPYLDAATIRNAVGAFRLAWAAGEISYGQVVQHIIGVRVQGRAAWVHDCDNTSNAGLQYARTGQIVPGSLGVADDNLVTRLNLVRGRWVVWVQTVEDVPCRP